MIRYVRPRRKRDSTIPLINVVFLMLIFFLIAGTVAPPLDPDLELVDTAELEGREPPDALVLHKDGTLSFRGASIDPETYMASRDAGPVRIVPDRNASGPRLIEVTGALRRLGASSVFLVTEQALE
ncbi:biopolymer transporter ExbD [Rhodobacteraceae bacterium B1Z28]|uniref:Biopolymer transporter ExbD n=1 Tax=Ruegeria haliotis TaxID=2747601 RepID=A0ABX2PL47_9RHOB|nr:biopolymer transporter ExbD [Ruegeria haliotis]NVO54201.1 biopolymer transporter ExbD [Ruegeria haliotis]